MIELVEQGGFVMPPLILLSLILFTSLFRLAFELFKVSRNEHPALGVNASLQTENIDTHTLANERIEWNFHFDRRLKFIRILAASAPLLGLLGTVVGMLKTFTALGLKTGFETIDLVASGISEALITTETGLSIAIVGLTFIWALNSWRRRLTLRFESCENKFTLNRFNFCIPC